MWHTEAPHKAAPGRRVCALILIVVVCAAGFSTPASAVDATCDGASQSEAAGGIQLCGDTVVEGIGGSVIEVTVAQDLSISLETTGFSGRFNDIQLHAAGPVAGFVLTDDQGEDAKYLYVASLREDFHSGFYPDVWQTNFQTANENTVLVPAGVYSLYLISDGRPVTANLHLPSLTGAVVLRPDRVARLQLKTLENRLPSSSGAITAFSGGEAATMQASGLIVLSAARTSQTIETADAWGFCFYNGAPDPAAVSFLPGCPARATGTEATQFLGTGLSPIANVQWLVTTLKGTPGQYAPGIWFKVPTPVEHAAAFALWLEFAPSD